MTFLSDYTAVKFTGLDHIFNVYSTFVEFTLPVVDIQVSIKFYGLIIAFGFLLAVLFGGRMAYKWKLDLNKMLDVLLFGTIGGIVGARLYYVAFEWEYYSSHLSEIPQIWNGGLAIYGGLIGGVLAAFITCKCNKLNFLKLLDLAGMSFLIGQGIGRWGNFTNQEAFGINTSMPWGMSSEKISAYIINHQSELSANGISINSAEPVHPTFLYESLWCLVGFALIYLVCKKWYKFSGQLILCYGIVYGAERAVVEGLRTDSLYIGSTGLRISQVLSVLIVLCCAAVMIAKLVELKKNPVAFSPVEVLPEEIDYELDDKEEKKKKVLGNAKKAKQNLKKKKKEERKAIMKKKERQNDGKNNGR